MTISAKTLTRRGFLGTTVGIATVAASQRFALPFASSIPIGVQLYCVRKELAEDFDPTMEAVAKIGFAGVEFADYFNRSAKELRKSLDDNGLKACGTHIFLEDMLGDKLEGTVEFNKILGNPYLIVRWLPEPRRNSPEAFQETVRLFGEVAEKLRPHGMRIGYHNHDYIFGKQNGKIMWNILADETPKDVILQIDTGNASVTDVDVIDLMARNKGRSGTVHIKPYSSKKKDAFIGDDELDWERIINICETTGGTEWYIIEYEEEGHPPLEALKANTESFKALVAKYA